MKNDKNDIQCKECSQCPLIGIIYENGNVKIESKCENEHYNIEEFCEFYKRNLNASSSLLLSNADDEYKYKTKKSFEKLTIEEINNYENQIKEIENQYFKFIKNAGDIYDELTKYQESFLKAMLKYKELNISQINFCKNLIKNYKELEKENKLNYEIISNIKNILNFKPINFTIDKNFSILSKVQKYFSYL